MPKMIPAHIYAGTKSPGEVEIFQRLRDDPLTKTWIVLHSLDISHHRSQISGEVDFLVIVPNKGILCLEVKAHRLIQRERGLWYYGSSGTADARGPFEQASEAMHSLRKRVVGRYPYLSKVVFWSAVIFPFLEFNISGDEWHPWQVIGCNQFNQHSIGKLLLNVLDSARSFLSQNPNAPWFDKKSNIPDNQQCEQIGSFLRPDFEFFESPKSRSGRIEKELKLYTEEQYDALDAMDLNDQVIFSGPAGTGKTLLAIEAARRGTIGGRKILLCCYNKFLGAWLRSQTDKLLSQESVGTLHSIMLSIAQLTPPANPGHEFWDSELPAKAIERLLFDETDKYKFDELIIDEVQDLLKDIYLDVLDLLLVGGLRSGKWKFFGDFERQTIYASSSEEVNRLLQQRFSNVSRYGLRINCRNTPRIAALVRLIGGLQPDYFRIRRPDNEVEPEIVPYKSEEQQKEKLIHILATLSRAGYKGSEITILSPKNDVDSVASRINSAPLPLTAMRYKRDDNEVAYCTIQSYKGLESSIIIVTDVENMERDKSASLFYIAITRSVERLFILVSETARKEILGILTTSR